LSPLEIGLHALRAVPLAQGKKGKGLTEYAGRLGKKHQYITQVRQAAEVFDALHKSTCEAVAFLDKAQHLAAIHKLPAAGRQAEAGKHGTKGGRGKKKPCDNSLPQGLDRHPTDTARARAAGTNRTGGRPGNLRCVRRSWPG
jgi:hypothetical protein